MKQFKEILINLNYKVYLLPLILLIIDQIIKKIVLIFLFKDMKQLTISSFLNLTPVWNKGVSFGMFSQSGDIGKIIFIIIGVCFGFFAPIISKNWKQEEKFGVLLISGGAFGNSFDRIIHGKVIDFIDFHYKNIHWPAFNFADICISIGVVIILYSSISLSKSKKLQ